MRVIVSLACSCAIARMIEEADKEEGGKYFRANRFLPSSMLPFILPRHMSSPLSSIASSLETHLCLQSKKSCRLGALMAKSMVTLLVPSTAKESVAVRPRQSWLDRVFSESQSYDLITRAPRRERLCMLQCHDAQCFQFTGSVCLHPPPHGSPAQDSLSEHSYIQQWSILSILKNITEEKVVSTGCRHQQSCVTSQLCLVACRSRRNGSDACTLWPLS